MPLTKKLTHSLKNYANSRVKSPKPLRDKKREPLTLSQAEQVAHLLNEHNNLQTSYNGSKILNAKAAYYPEHFQGLVFGSVAVQRMNFMLTEIKHLVVHPAFRKMGLAQLMLGKAMKAAETPLLFATIREDNEASMALFQKEGFQVVARAVIGDHKTVFLLRNNESYIPDSPKSSRRKYESAPFGYPFGPEGS